MTRIFNDAYYKIRFADPGVVADLLRTFVDEPWVRDLAWETPEP